MYAGTWVMYKAIPETYADASARNARLLLLLLLLVLHFFPIFSSFWPNGMGFAKAGWTFTF